MHGLLLRVVIVVCVFLAGAAAASPTAAGPVTGVVRAVARSGTAPATAIVYAEPIDGTPPRSPRRVTLSQKNKTFLPRVLAVPLGSTVDFPNNDDIHHNVFSLSGPQPFDLGLYRSGESRPRTFTEPGIYRVFCNIHPQMTAMVLVAPSAFTALVAADGRFTLDLPPGRYRAHGVVGAVVAGLDRNRQHAGGLNRAGDHTRRIDLALRAAQGQVRQGLSSRGVQALNGRPSTVHRRRSTVVDSQPVHSCRQSNCGPSRPPTA